MRRVLTLTVACAAVIVTLTAWAADAKKSADAPDAKEAVKKAVDSPFKTERDQISYAIGVQIGKDFKAKGIDINPSVLAQAVSDAMADKKLAMADDQIRQVLTELRQKMMAKMQNQMKEMGAENLAKGEAYMADNAKKKGVKTQPSGLQYRVIKAGEGKSPSLNDQVKVHYRGTMIDGKEFDSSYKRGEPAVIPLRGVIKGWQEALPLMKEGGKWQIVVPPDLAYGETGGGPMQPNSTLVFDIELIEVIPGKAKPAEEKK